MKVTTELHFSNTKVVYIGLHIRSSEGKIYKIWELPEQLLNVFLSLAEVRIYLCYKIRTGSGEGSPFQRDEDKKPAGHSSWLRALCRGHPSF